MPTRKTADEPYGYSGNTADGTAFKSIGNAENNRIPAKAKDGWLYLDYAGKKQLLLKRGGRCHRVQKRKSRRQDRW